MAETIICSKCNIGKEATEINFAFRRDAQRLRRTCRDCQRRQRVERMYANDGYYRQLRRERLRARRSRKKKPEINRRACAKWREKNPERRRELARAYRARRGGQYLREWRERNRERYNVYMRDWRRLRSFKTTGAAKLVNMVASALPSGLPVEIKDEVMQELLTRVLDGKIRLSEVKREVKPAIAKFYRDYANRSLLSLDAPISGLENVTFSEMVEG